MRFLLILLLSMTSLTYADKKNLSDSKPIVKQKIKCQIKHNKTYILKRVLYQQKM